MKALIVMPTYNESENLPHIIEAILNTDDIFHILVVDDNSPDGTGKIADHIASQISRVNVIHRPKKLGLGTAYIEGFRWALKGDYDVIFEMDADFSHHPRYLIPMLRLIENAHM
ncbi:MAG: glycosyltransferase, partial [bacterium]